MRQHQADQNVSYRIPEEERQNEAGNSFDEIMAEYFSSLGKEKHFHFQETQRVTNLKTTTQTEEEGIPPHSL